jgi:hypothetical protein
MAQACLTQYFTPKRSRHSSTILANGDSIKSQKRKLKIEDENNENVCSLSNKKRRISKKKTNLFFCFFNIHLKVQHNQQMVIYKVVT